MNQRGTVGGCLVGGREAHDRDQNKAIRAVCEVADELKNGSGYRSYCI